MSSNCSLKLQKWKKMKKNIYIYIFGNEFWKLSTIVLSLSTHFEGKTAMFIASGPLLRSRANIKTPLRFSKKTFPSLILYALHVLILYTQIYSSPYTDLQAMRSWLILRSESSKFQGFLLKSVKREYIDEKNKSWSQKGKKIKGKKKNK